MIPAKIAKLIPTLSSTMDGEVVSAVRAIERALKAGGKDWHDLVKAIDFGGRPADPYASQSSQRRQPTDEERERMWEMFEELMKREKERREKEFSPRWYEWDEEQGRYRTKEKKRWNNNARYWEGKRRGEDEAA